MRFAPRGQRQDTRGLGPATAKKVFQHVKAHAVMDGMNGQRRGACSGLSQAGLLVVVRTGSRYKGVHAAVCMQSLPDQEQCDWTWT